MKSDFYVVWSIENGELWSEHGTLDDAEKSALEDADEAHTFLILKAIKKYEAVKAPVKVTTLK